MNHEFYDLLRDEENIDLLDEILNWMETGVDHPQEIETIHQKIEDLDEIGEEELADQLRQQIEYM